MKSKILKPLSLALTMVMAVGTIGCNSSSSGTTPSATPAAPAATSSANAATSAPTEAANNAPYELLGAVSKPAGELSAPRSSYVNYPIEEAKGITLTYWLPLATNVSKTSDNIGTTSFGKYFQEELGVTIDYKHPNIGNETEQFGLLIASASLPDIVEWEWTTTYSGGVSAALQDGLAIDLGEYIDPYGAAADLWQYLEDNPSVDRQVKSDDGVYYCFPFIRGSKYLQTTSGPLIRKDFLDQAGLDVPVTIDDWTEALKAFKSMGVNKPLSAIKTTGNLSQVFNIVTPAYSVRSDDFQINANDGKINYALSQDGMQEALRTLNMWYKEGLLDNEYATVDRTTLDAYMLNGTSGATYGAGGGMLGVYLASEATIDGYNLVATQFPVLNAGDKTMHGGASYEYATTSKASAAITADCKYPEIAAKVLNYAYSEKGHLTVNFGHEGVSFKQNADGSISYTDEVMRNSEWSIAVAMAHYGRANTSGPFVQDEDYIFEYYDLPQQKEALLIWGDNESQKTLIPPISLSTEESNEYAKIMADVKTYVHASLAEFVMGSKDVDKDWDAFVANVNGMNIQKLVDIYQTALDRYNAR